LAANDVHVHRGHVFILKLTRPVPQGAGRLLIPSFKPRPLILRTSTMTDDFAAIVGWFQDDVIALDKQLDEAACWVEAEGGHGLAVRTGAF
jgi:hypothetical protein